MYILGLLETEVAKTGLFASPCLRPFIRLSGLNNPRAAEWTLMKFDSLLVETPGFRFWLRSGNNNNGNFTRRHTCVFERGRVGGESPPGEFPGHSKRPNSGEHFTNVTLCVHIITHSCCLCRWDETTSLKCGHQRAYCSSPRWYMHMENDNGMIQRGKSPDSSTRASWQFYGYSNLAAKQYELSYS
jgi:hypothetical protein